MSEPLYLLTLQKSTAHMHVVICCPCVHQTCTLDKRPVCTQNGRTIIQLQLSREQGRQRRVAEMWQMHNACKACPLNFLRKFVSSWISSKNDLIQLIKQLVQYHVTNRMFASDNGQMTLQWQQNILATIKFHGYPVNHNNTVTYNAIWNSTSWKFLIPMTMQNGSATCRSPAGKPFLLPN